MQGNTDVPDQTVVQPLKRMVRVATEADKKTLARNKKRADEAFIICKRKIMERGLEMNLVTVECTFDMNKMLFYFTADGRVDFRELVKDLAGVFRTRIELRQIGVRDEAKMIGEMCIRDSYSGTQSTTADTKTEDEVKKIALAKVPGATENDIRLNLDRDDGKLRYEGKIIYDGMEYDFEIDAYSGAIQEWEAESVFD